MLYSSLCGECSLSKLNSDPIYAISVRDPQKNIRTFTKDGKYFAEDVFHGECLLFPSKEQRDWSKFLPFKDGDIVSTPSGSIFVFKKKDI